MVKIEGDISDTRYYIWTTVEIHSCNCNQAKQKQRTEHMIANKEQPVLHLFLHQTLVHSQSGPETS